MTTVLYFFFFERFLITTATVSVVGSSTVIAPDGSIVINTSTPSKFSTYPGVHSVTVETIDGTTNLCIEAINVSVGQS